MGEIASSGVGGAGAGGRGGGGGVALVTDAGVRPSTMEEAVRTWKVNHCSMFKELSFKFSFSLSSGVGIDFWFVRLEPMGHLSRS